MIIILSAIVIAAVAGCIVFLIVCNLRKNERKKYYAAAANIIKEDFLNYSLFNNAGNKDGVSEPNGQRMMVYIKTLHINPKLQFVFDPQKTITIGRNNDKSNIFINEALVSQNHCRIVAYKDKICLQDLNSANGTTVRRGLFKNYFVFEGKMMELKSGDKIKVGSNSFKIIIFFFDANIM